MQAFRNLPIQRKLTVAILGTTTIALLWACAVFIVRELSTYRSSTTEKLTVLADVLANNSTAALQFKNQRDSEEILRALKAAPEVTGACIYSEHGQCFAGYVPGKSWQQHDFGPPSASGSYSSNNRLHLFRPVILNGEQIGTIQIEASFDGIYARLRTYATISGIVLLGCLMLSLSLATWLQHLISDPILNLAATAKLIFDEKDYSVRADKANDDELGFLTDSFNQMLADIEDQTDSLRLANRAMEIEIAERRRAEERVQEHAALLDKAQDSILLEELNFGIRYWNQSASQLYGWKAQEVFNLQVSHILFSPEKPEPPEARIQTLRTGEWIGELSQITRDNQEIIVESRWTLIRDVAGAPKSILYVNSNITERKKLEAQFFRAQRLDSIGTLAGGIAHDLNNLLTPIALSTDILKDHVVSVEAQHILENIQTSAKRGGDILRQILTFARGTVGERRHLPIDRLVQEIGDFIRETFPRNISFESLVPAEIWSAQGDPTQIQQILINLCVNSRDAMPDGGTLTLQVSNRQVTEEDPLPHANAQVGSYVVIAVTDTGEGIPHELLDKIFDPFFTTKEVGQGTGLGLSIVFGIVKSHGGFITVDSAPGVGTTIEVFLPAKVDRENESPEDAPSKPHLGSGELILVVDDEAAIGALCAAVLGRGGYRVISAADGAEAIETYTAQQPNIALVITDIMMPIVDGITLARTLKAINPKVRIVVSTGQPDEARLSQLQEIGVAGFLKKPFNGAQLMKTVFEAIHSRGSNSFARFG